MDLVTIYTLYVRSLLEFNCCVWHFNLTKEEEGDLERVQKVACKIILKNDYLSYEDALYNLNLENLSQRRRNLCKKFAVKSLKFDKSKSMFPLDEDRNRNTSPTELTILQMQRLLNELK